MAKSAEYESTNKKRIKLVHMNKMKVNEDVREMINENPKKNNK